MGCFPTAAIKKARDRFDKAREALFKCRIAPSYDAFCTSWSDFLLHTGGVLNQLESGAKTHARARQWYGVRAKAGRNDPLVSYLHQARNIEEHDFSPVTKFEDGHISIGGGGEPMYISSLDTHDPAFRRDPTGYLRTRAINPVTKKPTSVVHSMGGPKLIAVEDKRHSTRFEPPEYHNGKPIADRTPLGIADLYIKYLQAGIEEAATLT